MKNILFISNNYKTPFFYKIGKHIENLKTNSNIFWMASNIRWINWLTNRNIKQQNILDNRFTKKEYQNFLEMLNSDNSIFEDFLRFEKELSLKTNNIILIDRNLRKQDYNESFYYILFLYWNIKKFIKSNNIKIVISEVTHADEIICSELAIFLGIDHYVIHPVRIPSNKFAFFKGPFQKEMVYFYDFANIDISKKFVRRYKKNKTRPSYFKHQAEEPSFKVSWVTKFFRHIYNNNIFPNGNKTAVTVPQLVRERVVEILDKYYLKFTSQIIRNISEIKSPFVFYAMQRQPEASVDVWAPFYSNQYEIIKNILRALPASHHFYIKLHPNAIGENTYGIIKKIKNIPGVKVLSPYIDSFKLLNKAELVATITGTIAYESFFFNTPALMFSELYFSEFSNVTVCKDFNNLNNIIFELLYNYKNKILEEDLFLLSKIINNSFKGIVSQPRANPNSIDENNLKRIVETFVENKII